MTASAVIADPAAPTFDGPARPSLARLTGAELRKMVDTRAGFWLQVTVLGLTLAFAIIQAVVGQAADHTLHDILVSAVLPVQVLLPVVGILLVSSEWSQRTTLVTFTLVPQRPRILVAKLAAGILLAVAAFLISLGLAVLITAIAAPATHGTWSLSGVVPAQILLLVVVSMVMGLGFGAMLLSSAPAIVLYFGLPLAWTALASIPALRGPARWLDAGRSFDPMTSHVMSAAEWAHVGTTLAAWMLLPVLIGIWRIARNEVS